MDYTFVPSLEHRALIKLTVTLWNEDDVWDSVLKFHSPTIRNGNWEKIENKVTEKVSKLPLAKSLKEKLSYFIKPVGLQIVRWADFHQYRCKFVKKLPDQFIWTAQGTIDKKKTAEILVNDESLRIFKRYKLACIYCLEEHIRDLFGRLLILLDVYEEHFENISKGEPLLVKYWFYNLSIPPDGLESVRKGYYTNSYEYAFLISARSGNEEATRYFLKKLSTEEKEKVLVKHTQDVIRFASYPDYKDFPKVNYTDVLCFLLNQMDKEQQIEVFKSRPYMVLKCFLNWPWQSFFMETAEHMWDFLSMKDYSILLCNIIEDKLMKEPKDFNYQQLFREFWQRSPSTHKRYVINQCILIGGSLILSHLFEIGDEQSIKLILKDSIAVQKERFFFIKGGNICKKLIYNGKWDLLKFFVRECISSKNMMTKFKKEFILFNIRLQSKEKLEKYMLNKFFELLDELIEKDDEKQSVKAGDDHTAKRFCSVTSERL